MSKSSVENKNKGFWSDTKSIILPKKGEVSAETIGMIFQIILYSLLFMGADFLVSSLLKVLC